MEHQNEQKLSFQFENQPQHNQKESIIKEEQKNDQYKKK